VLQLSFELSIYKATETWFETLMFKISMLRLSRAKNGIGANRQGDGVIMMVMVTWHGKKQAQFTATSLYIIWKCGLFGRFQS
jgi:hypothetical protein